MSIGVPTVFMVPRPLFTDPSTLHAGAGCPGTAADPQGSGDRFNCGQSSVRPSKDQCVDWLFARFSVCDEFEPIRQQAAQHRGPHRRWRPLGTATDDVEAVERWAGRITVPIESVSNPETEAL